ncbi:hypothetical protein LINPERHAP2_LOCUS38110 [Linum perenne]
MATRTCLTGATGFLGRRVLKVLSNIAIKVREPEIWEPFAPLDIHFKLEHFHQLVKRIELRRARHSGACILEERISHRFFIQRPSSIMVRSLVLVSHNRDCKPHVPV